MAHRVVWILNTIIIPCLASLLVNVYVLHIHIYLFKL